MGTPAGASSPLLHCASHDASRSVSPGSATGARTWRATSRRSRTPSSWCADPDDGARARIACAPGRQTTNDLDDLLTDDGLDAIALATPVPTHAELAVRVLEAGKHCFVEKPLAQSVADAERAVAAAERAARR